MKPPAMSATTTPPSRLREWLTWLCVSTPYLLLLGLVTLALHVRLGLGRWPVPIFENYVTVPYLLHEHYVYTWLLLTVIGSLPAWGLLLSFQRGQLSLRACAKQLACYALGWGLIFLTAILDPTPFTEWFLD